MRLLLDQDRGEAALEQMANSLMRPITGLRVAAVQLPHPLGQVWRRGFTHEMIVIVHQTIRMAQPPIAVHHVSKERPEHPPVGIRRDDRLPRVAATGDMIDGVRKLDA